MTEKSKDEAAASGRTPSAGQRRAVILQELAEHAVVQVISLAEGLGVSPMTLRRDLEEMERDGLLQRIHGGAVRPQGSGPVIVDTEEPQFQRRMERGRRAKEAIAGCAAGLLTEAQTLGIDVGSTTLYLARRLAERCHVKVFTNNLRVAQALADAAPDVYLAGGRVRPVEQAVGGPSALAQFQDLWFDAAIIGVSGVTQEGFFDYSFEDADMKRIYFSRATRRIILADSTKFNRMSLVQVGALAEATDLVTDSAPPEALAHALAEAGVRLHVAAAEIPKSLLRRTMTE